MKVEVLAENLSRAMKVVIRGVASKPQLSVLSFILIKASKNRLELVATDLEVSFIVSVGAKIEQKGEVLVPAKLMNDLVATLPAGLLKVVLKKQVLEIKGSGLNTKIYGQAVGEFPSVPCFAKLSLSLDAEEFKDKIGKVAIAAARDGTRPVFEGILWTLKKEGIGLAATDGYRLSVDELKGVSAGKVPIKGEFVLPVRAALELARMVGDDLSGEIKLDFDKAKQQVVFKINEVEMVSRLLGGEFPDFEQIVPDSYKTRVVVDREDLEMAVRRAGIFAKDNANVVQFKIGQGEVMISAVSAQTGENMSKITAEIEGEDLSAAFNGKYLIDYLGVITDKKVIFESGGDLKPGVFKLNKDKGLFLYIIMPIKQAD